MVVRMRATRSKTRHRRSHHGVTATRTVKCACGGIRMSHRACPECGKYRGRIVIDVVARTERQQRRSKQKEQELRRSGVSTGGDKSEKEDAKA